ncbi:hypothetical protein BH09PSE4_BH09PSE4_13570 [soil metagenome]
MDEAVGIARRPNGGVQNRRARAKRWSDARRAAFLEELAQTANVRMASAAAGMSTAGAYKLRKRDSIFAAAWLEALCDGFAKLDDLMLERALATIGGEGSVIIPAGDDSKMRELGERTVLALMTHHGPRVRAALEARRRASGSGDAIRELLEARFEDMHRRLQARDAAD